MTTTLLQFILFENQIKKEKMSMCLASKFALNKSCLDGWVVFLFLVAASVASPVQSHDFDKPLETPTVEAVFISPQNSSFQDSCRDIYVNGDILSARCRTERGRYTSTSIEIRGITNVNGNLEYLRDGRGRSTYQGTCTDTRVSGSNLTARCQREDGSYNDTSIFLRDINNNNGRLEYGRGGGGGGGSTNPPPSDNQADFQNSCRNISVNVTTLSAQCRDENRRWRDTSINIRGITNVSGNLEYLRDGRGPSTYQDTCRNVRINQATLTARCQREDGSFNRTSISLIGIVNDNGRLRYRLD